jgi:HK97 family phage major capsid protein
MARTAMPSDRNAEPLYLEPLPHHESEHPYSLAKAIRQCLTKPTSLDGLEREVSDEIARRSGRRADGFYVPLDVRVPRLRGGRERRDLDATGGAGGIGELFAPSQLIHVLRARSIFFRAGARMPMVSFGSFTLPRMATGSTVHWVGDGGAPTASAPQISKVAHTPKTLAGYVDFTRTLSKAGPEAEGLIYDDLAGAIAAEIDRAGLSGSGIGNEPLGALGHADVPSLGLGTDGGPPTRSLLLDMERSVATAGGDDDLGTAEDAAAAFITSPKGRHKLRRTTADGTAAGNNDAVLWQDVPGRADGPGPLLGYWAAATTAIPSDLTKGSGTDLTALLFGNFREATIPLWGVVDVLVNPYTFSTAGVVRLSMFQDADIQLRTPGAFVRVVDMTTD